jgi:hypothetical protein
MTPERYFFELDRVVWRIDRQNRQSRFRWALLQGTNKIENEKLTELVYVAPWRVGPCSSEDGELYPMRCTPECSELCKFWFSWVKVFRICGGRFRRITMGFRTCPCNCASTTVQHVINMMLLSMHTVSFLRLGSRHSSIHHYSLSIRNIETWVIALSFNNRKN